MFSAFLNKYIYFEDDFIFPSSYTIGIVQDNTEFYWRYQRYAFVREYFECLPLSYPPLIIVSHIILLMLTIYYKCRSKFRRNQVTDEYHLPISKKITRTFSKFPKIVIIFYVYIN